MSNMTWTQKDEQRFKELAERREQAMFAVTDLAEALSQALGGDCDTDRLGRHLINNADSIRDALAPFDSGAREAKPESIAREAPQMAACPAGRQF